MTDELTPIEVPDQDAPPEGLPTVEAGTEVWARLAHLRQLKQAKADLEERIKTESTALVPLLNKGARFTDGEGSLIEALVGGLGGKVVPDLVTLKKVDPIAYETVTTPKLESKKLKRALQAGLITPIGLTCFRTEPTDPFIRMTNLSNEESDADQE